MKKQLEQLRRSLPICDSAMDQESFRGNISQSHRFITDGHVLMLRSAIDPMKAGDIADFEGYWGKKPTEESILAVWGPATVRKNSPAEFIGCASCIKTPLKMPTLEDNDEISVDLAVIRDVGRRIVIVNPYLLAFIVAHVSPDFLNIPAGDRYLDAAVSFYKKGEMVALLMPMRYVKGDLPAYDFDGPAFRWSRNAAPFLILKGK